jgi:hypothetical protein
MVIGNLYSMWYETSTKIIQNDYTQSLIGLGISVATVCTYIGAETIAEIDQYVIDNELIDLDMVVSPH